MSYCVNSGSLIPNPQLQPLSGRLVIPYPLAPLTGLTVVVTRPLPQAALLSERIKSLGGSALMCPAIAIETITTTTTLEHYDCAIFVSANAVEHGLKLLPNNISIAAIGPATAKAIQAAKRDVHILAPAPFTSEALLSLSEMHSVAGKRFAIIRGEGGREILADTLIERGAQVDNISVYRRVPLPPTPQALNQLRETRDSGAPQLLSFTSAEILQQWTTSMMPLDNAIRFDPMIVASSRIAALAREQGLLGECIVAAAASEDALIGAMANWNARARNGQ
jgi:uroporphyrinogen-III synthase